MIHARSRLPWLSLSLLLLAACDSQDGHLADEGRRDLPVDRHDAGRSTDQTEPGGDGPAARTDGPPAPDRGLTDAPGDAPGDLRLDAAPGRDSLPADCGPGDLLPPADLGADRSLAAAPAADLGRDSRPPDLPPPADLPPPPPDSSQLPDQTAPLPGLSTPCANGPGWSLFRFGYSANSTSPSIDVWEASCSYSYAPGSACNAVLVYPGFGEVSRTDQGYPILTTSEYLRVRFSVAGLSFSSAAVYLQARSYATASSTNYEIWSPLYGSQYGGPVDNDWTYDWYGLDWTGYLTPADDPDLTAIQVYAAWGSGSLAVKAVELCLQ